MARRKKTEEPSNHERWLVSYADFITLLFAFFVTMYALSSVNESKYKVLSNSLSTAFNPSSYSSDKINIGLTLPDELKGGSTFIAKNSDTYKNVFYVLKDLENDGAAIIVPDRRGVVVRLTDSVIFDRGKDQLLPAAEGILDQVAETLKYEDGLIRIEGHTDNSPVKTAQFPSSWELSSSRAVNVLRYLVDKHGVKPGRLSALGFGAYRPIADNGSSEGRAKNGRIDIVILNEEGSGSEPR
ncbi:MAG: flagellar motor protein MotB [Thermodesulfobacteriota bacterium]